MLRSRDGGTKVTEEVKKRFAFILVLAILIAGGSFYFYGQKNSSEQTMANVSTDLDGAAKAKPERDEIVVYISGAVNKPGILRVPAGSRVVDVVNSAGGFAPGADADKVNLAKAVKDGMHVNVPMAAVPAMKNTGASSHTSTRSNQTNTNANVRNSANSNDIVNINFASKDELDKLPGIGPSLAERIIEYRQENGNFGELIELKKVPGIGEAKFNQIKDKITL